MKNIFTQIFVTLGVIFLILILVCIYFFVTDPFNLKPMIFGSGPVVTQEKSTNTTAPINTTTTATQGGFTLSDAQKQALVSFGIDPATVPRIYQCRKRNMFH